MVAFANIATTNFEPWIHCCIVGCTAALWDTLLHCGMHCCIVGYTAALWDTWNGEIHAVVL